METILYEIRCSAGSQCRTSSMYLETWPNLGMPPIRRAAECKTRSKHLSRQTGRMIVVVIIMVVVVYRATVLYNLSYLFLHYINNTLMIFLIIKLSNKSPSKASAFGTVLLKNLVIS